MCGCYLERSAMPRTRLSHPVCLQRPCVSPLALMRPEIVSRDRQLRWTRVLCFWLASMAPLMSSVAEKLRDSVLMKRSTCRCGPLGVDLRLVRSMLYICSNVDAWASPAYSGRIYTPAARYVGFKLTREDARSWRAMPSIPHVDPVHEGVL